MSSPVRSAHDIRDLTRLSWSDITPVSRLIFTCHPGALAIHPHTRAPRPRARPPAPALAAPRSAIEDRHASVVLSSSDPHAPARRTPLLPLPSHHPLGRPPFETGR